MPFSNDSIYQRKANPPQFIAKLRRKLGVQPSPILPINMTALADYPIRCHLFEVLRGGKFSYVTPFPIAAFRSKAKESPLTIYFRERAYYILVIRNTIKSSLFGG